MMTNYSEVKKTEDTVTVFIKEDGASEEELMGEFLSFDFRHNNSLSFNVSRFIHVPGYGNIPWAVGIYITHPEPLEPKKYPFFVPWIGAYYSPPRPENSWISRDDRTDIISFTDVDFDKGRAKGTFEFFVYKPNDPSGKRAFVHGNFSLNTSKI